MLIVQTDGVINISKLYKTYFNYIWSPSPLLSSLHFWKFPPEKTLFYLCVLCLKTYLRKCWCLTSLVWFAFNMNMSTPIYFFSLYNFVLFNKKHFCSPPAYEHGGLFYYLDNVKTVTVNKMCVFLLYTDYYSLCMYI